MEFTILGRTKLIVDGRSVDLGAKKQRALLTLLLIKLGQPVPVETITTQLWKGKSRVEVRANLHSLVSRLRRVLKRAEAPCKLWHEDDAYCLVLNAQLVDYHRFRRQAELGRSAAREGNHVQARRLLRGATDMWQGDALTDLRTDWAAQRRHQMKCHDLLPAQYALINSELELREHADALHRIVQLMDEYPLDEILARQRLQALDGLGRFAEAIEFHTQFHRHYREDYGAEPPIEVREVYGQILRKREGPARPSIADRTAPLQQVPRPVHNFTGRTDLLAALDVLLPDADTGRPAPVVALTGMGGIGKTALAVYWAYRHRDHFPDGQLFYNLNGYSHGTPVSADDVMAKLLEALGTAPELIPANSDQRQEKLSRLLGDRKILVVLDNVRDPSQVRPLLAAMAHCSVLATSRDQLAGLAVRDGVRTKVVPTLSAAESIALLRSEIGDTRVHCEPPDLCDLAELTAGLPLALKLLGHHAATRPRTELADLVKEIGGRYGLVAAAMDNDDETASLAAAFALSYNALAPEAARLFRLLGLHPGPSFGNQVAGALLGQPAHDAEQLLKSLSRVHLLQPDGLHRYRFHDLLHVYAADRASSDEPADQRLMAITRMIDWYLRTATNACRLLAPQSEPVPPAPTSKGVTPLTFDADQAALHWCSQERDNLIAATRCAAEHNLHEHAWRIPATMNEVFERSGFHDDFLETVPIALDSARYIKDNVAEIGLLNILGRSHFGRHDHERALPHFERALAIATEIGHAQGQAVSQHNLACTYIELDKVGAAIEIYQQTLRLDRETGDRAGEAYSLDRLANAYQRLGQHWKALQNYHEALRIRREIDHFRGQGATLTELAGLHHQRGEYDQALEYGHQALKLNEQSGDATRAIEALTTLAAIHYETQVFHESVSYAERAVELCGVTQDLPALARALHTLGHAQCSLGDLTAANEQWERAAAIFEELGDQELAVVRDHLHSIDGRDKIIPEPRSYSAGKACRPGATSSRRRMANG